MRGRTKSKPPSRNRGKLLIPVMAVGAAASIFGLVKLLENKPPNVSPAPLQIISPNQPTIQSPPRIVVLPSPRPSLPKRRPPPRPRPSPPAVGALGLVNLLALFPDPEQEKAVPRGPGLPKLTPKILFSEASPKTPLPLPRDWISNTIWPGSNANTVVGLFLEANIFELQESPGGSCLLEKQLATPTIVRDSQQLNNILGVSPNAKEALAAVSPEHRNFWQQYGQKMGNVIGKLAGSLPCHLKVFVTQSIKIAKNLLKGLWWIAWPIITLSPFIVYGLYWLYWENPGIVLASSAMLENVRTTMFANIVPQYQQYVAVHEPLSVFDFIHQQPIFVRSTILPAVATVISHSYPMIQSLAQNIVPVLLTSLGLSIVNIPASLISFFVMASCYALKVGISQYAMAKTQSELAEWMIQLAPAFVTKALLGPKRLNIADPRVQEQLTLGRSTTATTSEYFRNVLGYDPDRQEIWTHEAALQDSLFAPEELEIAVAEPIYPGTLVEVSSSGVVVPEELREVALQAKEAKLARERENLREHLFWG